MKTTRCPSVKKIDLSHSYLIFPPLSFFFAFPLINIPFHKSVPRSLYFQTLWFLFLFPSYFLWISKVSLSIFSLFSSTLKKLFSKTISLSQLNFHFRSYFSGISFIERDLWNRTFNRLKYIHANPSILEVSKYVFSTNRIKQDS